ncbi:MAG: DUF6070 family protein [Oscillospiraceae bacterium]
MPEKEYDTVDEVPDKVMNALKKEAETAMLSTRDTYDSLDKGTALNVVLSQDSVAQIVYTLAENGYSAIDYFGNMDMQNPQPLIDFGNAVNAGQDAEAAYYVVHTDGSIHANNLVYITTAWARSSRYRSSGGRKPKDIFGWAILAFGDKIHRKGLAYLQQVYRQL